MVRNLPAYLSILTLFISSAFSGPTPPPYRTQIERYNGQKTGRYIVTLKEGASTAAVINQLANLVPDLANIVDTFNCAINGFAAELPATALALLQTLPDVKTISEDGIMHATAAISQPNAPWGLARLSSNRRLENQNPSELNFRYTYDHSSAGNGVDIYVVDTGVRVSHTDFGGRAQWGANFAVGSKDEDVHGHGTHVAGTAAGTRYGVAKSAEIIAVKVLGDDGSGTTAGIVGGLNWVCLRSKQTGKPSVVNMSLGGGASTPLDDATRNLVKNGVHVVVAAGNSNEDAQNTSPAHVEEAITVGASTIEDKRAFFSNYGSVVDVFAPGLNITSAWKDSDTAHLWPPPHVAGLVAYLISQPGGNIAPEAMGTKLKTLGRSGALADIPAGTANILAQNEFGRA
ncbi:hypothetical protein H1R20_g8753, partial [Candolleomyces eurysporus]